MNANGYRQRLLEMERTLSAHIAAAEASVGELVEDSPGDPADRGNAELMASARFADTARESDELDEVREALLRIEAGTFGKCVVDGAAIGKKRLDAVPWTRYCLEHQDELEAAAVTPRR